MEILFIVLVLFLGIVFILLEIIVFPGVSVAGIAGVVFLVLGVYMAYSHHGNVVGHLTLAGTFVAAVGATALAFRYSSWRKVALQTELEGKVETLKDAGIEPGDEGVALSRLAPMGSAKIKGRIVEAKSRDGYINEGVAVKVVKIKRNTVLVEGAEAADS